jgi:acyl carrier protein
MNNADRIRAAVYRTIHAVNDLLPDGQTLAINDDVVLVGQTATLDSMGFVNFIVALEEELEQELHRGFNIADLLAMQGHDQTSALTVADVITLLENRLG